MYPSYSYPYSFQNQSQPPPWTSEPTFYNGYSTNLTQPQFVAQTSFVPTESQYKKSPHSQFYSSSMKSYNRLRNAFSFSNHHQSNNCDDEYLYHETQLNQNLVNHNIERIPVKGDGNCLFYALAQGLIHEMNMDPNRFGLHLRDLFRLRTNFRLVEFADRLRQICVDQWRLHEDYYSQFVDKENVTFLKEVKKFSKNGVSDSTLGDIVPLTIANTLNINITIFTSLFDLPRIDVKPEYRSHLLSFTGKTIYLAYNQYGIGHYDAAYPRT